MTSKRMSRRSFLQLTAAGTAGAFFAACAAPPAAEPAAEEGGEMMAEEATELRLSHWWGEQHNHWLPIVEEKANVKVAQEIYPWGEYLTKVLTQVAGGVAPDIIQLDQSHNADFFPKNIFVPFNDYLAGSGLDMSKWNVDPALELGYNGDILALSLFTMQGRSVYLNLDLVRAAGYPEEELPLYGRDNYDTWHWDDFVEFLQAVTIQASDGTYEQYGYAGAIRDAHSLAYQMASYDADLVDDPWTFAETEALLDSEDAIAAAHDLIDLTIVHGVAPTIEAQQGIEGGLFRAGIAAATISWTNQSLLAAELPFELGFMHLPFTGRRVHGIGANHWSVNTASDNIPHAQEAALIQTTDYEVGQALVDLAATISAYDPAYYLDTLPEGDLGVITRIMLSRLAGMSDCDYCTEDVNMFNRAGFGRKGRFLQDTVRAEMEKALIGEKSVEQAMQDADAAIDEEIARE
ncbi:MAG: extracellular solute-binding protein [Caldilineaceae bacterium]|nr:extracellular solute-binding protein [Caldilineaceae bacterium]MCY4090912.1 extracellular solute-binding protein [Caldilineaceae bacterium]MCY4118984.1 extracellular solute-binding protein [Caldilineaceae bacterium]MDE0181833.1 extracellular solute-binding protein [Caldilineaceae bacterium]